MALFDDIKRAREKREKIRSISFAPGPQSKVPDIRNIPSQSREVISKAPVKKKSFFANNFVAQAIKRALFGDVKEKAAIKDIEEKGGKVPLREKFVVEGFLPFLGKTNEEQVTSRTVALEKKGIDKSRANDIAFYSVFKNKVGTPLNPEVIKQSKLADEKLEELQLTGQEKRVVALQNIFQKGGELLDVTTFGVGSIGKKSAFKIAKSKSAIEIAELLRLEFTTLTDNVIEVLSKNLTKVDNVDDVQKVLNRVDFSTKGITPSTKAVVPVKAQLDEFKNIDVFHGSEVKNIDDFKLVAPEAIDDIPGVSFTTDIDYARTFGKNIFKRTITPKNPLIIEDGTSLPEALKELGFNVQQADDGAGTFLLNDIMKEQGWDSIIMKGDPNEIVVLDKSIIKETPPTVFKTFTSTDGAEIITITEAPKILKGKWFRGVRQENQAGDMFMSSSKSVAGEFGAVRNIKPAELPKNPLIVSGNKEMFMSEIGYNEAKWGSPLAEIKGIPDAERYDVLIKKYAEERGFDGVLYTDGTLESAEVVKFRDITPTKKPPVKKTPTKEVPEDLDFEPKPVNIKEKVIIAVQDKLRRLDTIVEQTVEKGGKLTQESDALTKARLFTGKATERINKMRNEFASKAEDSLTSVLTKEKKSIDDFGDYLKARHAAERNAHVASINKKIPEGGSGLTNAQANEILSKLDGKGFEKFASKVDDLNTSTLDTLEEAGILSAESRATIEGTFENYVPLKIDKKPSKSGTGGKGFSVGSSGIKRVKGSIKERVNPFIQSLVDAENAIVRAEKNKVGQSFLEFVRENPNEKLWKVDKQAFIPHFNEEGEFIMAQPRLQATDNVLEVWEDGKLLHITIKDEELAKAMKNLGQERIIPVLAHFNNYLRAIVTTFNPEFVVSNFERDIQTAIINTLGERESIKDGAEVIKNVPKAMKGIFGNIKTQGKSDGVWSQLYQEFKDEGAKVGWIDARDVTDRSREIDKLIKRQEGATLATRMGRRLDLVADFVESANEIVESSTRLAVYKAMKDAGKTAQDAALIARDITVDFNKKGNLGTLLNSLYLFSNAGIQGGTKIFTTLYKSPLARKVVAGIAAGSFGIAELNRNTNKEEWRKVPDYIKDTNIIMMLPNGKSIMIRSPYGYNVFAAMGTIANDVVHQDITPGEAMKRLVLAFDAGFNPLGSGSLSQTIAPTVADPFIQVTENKNFAGNPIRPGQYPGSEKPNSQLFFSSVRTVSKETAEAVNKLTGGSQVESGVVDVSPEDIDHWIDFIGGGVGKFIANTMETGVSFLHGEMPSVNNMPIVRKFMYENNESASKYSIFNLKDRSRTHVLSEIELRRLARDIQDAVIPNAEGVPLMTADEALKQTNSILNNQARLKGGKIAEQILGGKITQSEAKALLEDLSSEEADQVIKALERLTEER